MRSTNYVHRTGVIFAAIVVCGLTVSSSASAQSSAQTIRQTLPKMVKIIGSGGIAKLHGYSTGFIVRKEGYIATVWNHVLDADEVTVILADGRKYMAKLVNAEPQLDLAILKIKAEGLQLPSFDLKKDTGTGSPGTRVLGFSNMFKVATGDEPVSVLHGVIAAKTKLSARRGVFEVPYDGPVYVVDAITNNPGAGGGVLMSRTGKLLGMLGREVRNTKSNTWMNYAIPVTELRTTVDEIIAGKFAPKKKKLAADNPNNYNPLDFGIVMVPDVVFRTPAYIDSVLPGSAAAKAGLRPDDLVLFVKDELIQSNKTLNAELGHLQSGDNFQLVVRRGSKLVTVSFTAPKKATKKTP